MKTFRAISSRSIFAGAFLAAMATTSAFAITDSDFTYSTPKRGVITIHQASFAPHDSNAAQNFSANNPNSYLRGDGCYSRALQLPVGAKFRTLRTRTLSTTTEGLPVYIHAQQIFNDGEVHVLNVKAGANAPGVSAITVFPIAAAVPALDENTAYVLTVCLKPGQFFKGARLEYTVTNAGD